MALLQCAVFPLCSGSAALQPQAGTVAKDGVTLQGSCESGLAISITGSGIAAADQTTCDNGAFTKAVTFSAGDGQKNIIVSQTNSQNATGSDSRSFVTFAGRDVIIITPRAGQPE